MSRQQLYGPSEVTAREAWDELQNKFHRQLTPRDLLEKLEKLAELRMLWLQY